MGFVKAVVGVLVLLSSNAITSNAVDCSTVAMLLSTCSTFITYGSPDPLPGTPCCDAMTNLNVISSTPPDSRRLVCACIMGLVTTYNPNATAIATLPGFCGVSFGFAIDPNTDCSLII